ncbi:MAG: rod shape-determining protein MreD [Candidatus Kapaibacterium sp.]|nr:MAG: rod shape-determining protein MreD [Bacteroidota bacterium]WKZ78428.1 MAG: rod shape-determining protein MreD [Candidatus Kapabacteria bacterium]
MTAGTHQRNIMASPAMRGLLYATVALVLTVIHVVFLGFVAFGIVTPDLLMILVVWIALEEGQFTATIAGFAIGLLYDAAGADVLGSNALAKTAAGFAAGYFYRPGMGRTTIGSYRFLLIVFAAGLVHNLLYFTLYVQPMQVSFWQFVITFGFATTFYTTVVAVFPMLYVNRKKEW